MKKSTGYLIAGLVVLALLSRRHGAEMSSDAEYGFAVFQRDGQFVKGQEATGTRYNVTVPTDSPPGYRPMAIYHTHPPEALLSPSGADYDAARKYGFPSICVGRDGEMECYGVER